MASKVLVFIGLIEELQRGEDMAADGEIRRCSPSSTRPSPCSPHMRQAAPQRASQGYDATRMRTFRKSLFYALLFLFPNH